MEDSEVMRYRNKFYWRIPGGEVQIGLRSKRLTIWFHGRAFSFAVLPERMKKKPQQEPKERKND